MNDFKMYLGLGWDHIISTGALDHILFILALSAIYVIKEWKRVLVLVTAFTIGHSITLALSAYNFVHLSSRWVEFFIPCTIFITAFSNLFQKVFSSRQIRINYFYALFFGLVHGLGFASGLRSLLGKNESIVTPLLGFNIGLECGQIVIVTIILFISYLAINGLKVAREKWILFLSAGVFSLALKMAIERWPGL